MPKLTIAIPTHQMTNGDKFLRQSLRVLAGQTFQDFEVVVSDNSDNDELEKIVYNFKGLDIHYFRNPDKGMASNTNYAIRHSRGKYIKILYLDDFMAGFHALQELADKLNDARWLVTGCAHTQDGLEWFNPHYPKYNSRIYLGENTIGSPSVLTIRNSDVMYFDENMTWLLDCDYYQRMYDKYGEPTILNQVNVIIRIGKHQMTNILSDELKLAEQHYLINKYKYA